MAFAIGGCRKDERNSTPLAGTPERPELTESQASRHTILGYLEHTGPVTAPARDGWNPSKGVGDVQTFRPKYTVAATGGSHTTVQGAIDAARAAGGTSRVFVRVSPGTYREVVCVPEGAPPITLYGSSADAARTVIVYDNYNGKPKPVDQPANPCHPSIGSATYGTFGSATFAVNASDFQAKNLTFSNDTEENALTNVQAVALMTQGDRLSFENVRLLGNQDTLYVKTPSPGTIARAYFKGSYIEGDVDFIFGRATFVLDGCEIKYLTARQGKKGGNPLAPSTDSRNPFGILVINSTFSAEPGTADGSVQLGRAWDEGQKNVPTYAANVKTGVYPNGQALVRDSELGPHIKRDAPWRSAATTDRPFNSRQGTLPANRLHEYMNRGPGSAAR
jgi:pectinesterase